jgi:hypothetical protein
MSENGLRKLFRIIIIHTGTLSGIVYVEKNYCDLFPVIFFFYRRNTYLRYYAILVGEHDYRTQFWKRTIQ